MQVKTHLCRGSRPLARPPHTWLEQPPSIPWNRKSMWKSAGLEEPSVSKVKAGKDWGAAEIEGGEQVDNLEAGGFFAHYGREPTRNRPTVCTRA